MVKKTDEPVRPIIVKKVTVVAAGHHGGAWKVAYADFVTAMMAFFLLLWILGATTEKQRRGIADYFSPTLVKNRINGTGSGTGLLGGTSLNAKDQLPHPGGSGNKAITVPLDAKGGPKATSARPRKARQDIEKKLQSTAQLRKLAKQVRLIDTREGVRIDLVDDTDFSMFRLGTTVLTNPASELLNALSETLGADKGGVIIRGHTDALPFTPGTSGNNWSLSAGRAEATRQALMRDGLANQRFRRIEGVADQEPLIQENPHDPRNRRISITLLD